MLVRPASRHVRDFICDSRNWDNYRPRPGDVVVATAPKVGTTWTQRIVSLLIFQTPEARPIGPPVSPWIDCRFQIPIEVALGIIEGQQHRRFLKSHLPFDALPVYDEVRYIHVGRDPRDACTSFMDHFNNFTADAWADVDRVGLGDPTIGRTMPRPPKTTREFFDYWLDEGNRQGAPMADMFFRIERSYWAERQRPNLLMVHYNDLKADLAGEMRRIAAFLEIEVAQTLWPALIDAATFATMKRDGAVVLEGMEHAFRGGYETFLNKGTNERWRGVLTEADLARYAARLATETTPALAQWLAQGRHAAGDPTVASD